jgi:hypothetical protein
MTACSGARARPAPPAAPSKHAFLNGRADRVRLYGANIFQQYAGERFTPTITERDFAELRANGANLVVLSVPGTFRGREPWPAMRAHLDSLVDRATAADLFVLVAFRTAPGRSEGDLTVGEKTNTLYSDPEDQRAFARMWRELALDYRKRPRVVGYDLLVEPHDVETARWRAVAQLAVDSIRSVDTDTAIVIEAPPWANASSLAGLEPLVGEHLVYGVHQYEPYAYTHENEALWSPTQLEAPFAAIDAFRKRTGATVIVNEWGARMNRPALEAFFRAELGQLHARDLDHAVWLWEVADESGYRAFDVRSSPAVLRVLRDAWACPTCTL